MSDTWKTIEFQEKDLTKHYIKDEVATDLDSLYLQNRLYARRITVASPDGLSEIEIMVNDDTGLINIANYADVMTFGAVGDGVTDDTAAIQDAIDYISEGTVFFPTPPVSYKRGILTIANKTNFTLDGNNALQVLDTDEPHANILLEGTCTNVTLTRLNILGDGIVDYDPINPDNGNLVHGHYGIGNLSGQTLSNITISHCRIKNVAVAISVNAESGGSGDSILIEDNHVEIVKGYRSGSGYGIHNASCTNVKKINNTVIDAERHAIYMGRGGNTIIEGNYVKDHRRQIWIDDPTGNALLPRAAVDISRCKDVSCIGNTIVDSYSPAIMCLSNEITTPQTFNNPLNGILIADNIIVDQHIHNGVYIGYSDPDLFQTLQNVKITGNIFKISEAVACIALQFGFNLDVSDNTFILTPTTGLFAKAISIRGLGSIPITYSDNWTIRNNTFSLSGAGTGCCLQVEEAADPGTFTVVAEYNYATSNITLVDWVSANANPNLNLPVLGFFHINRSGIGLELHSLTNASGIKLINASDRYAWIAASQYNIDECFEITPSTVPGGDTFSTPSLKIFRSGNIVTGDLLPLNRLNVFGDGFRLSNSSTWDIIARFGWDGTDDIFRIDRVDHDTAADNILTLLKIDSSGDMTLIGSLSGVTTLTAASISCATVPTISSGTAAPSTTPTKIGDFFIDTANVKLYVSTGTSSSSDWTILN